MRRNKDNEIPSIIDDDGTEIKAHYEYFNDGTVSSIRYPAYIKELRDHVKKIPNIDAMVAQAREFLGIDKSTPKSFKTSDVLKRAFEIHQENFAMLYVTDILSKALQEFGLNASFELDELTYKERDALFDLNKDINKTTWILQSLYKAAVKKGI